MNTPPPLGAPRRWRPTPLIGGAIAIHAGALATLAVSPAGWPWAAGGVVASHLALTAAGLWPRSALLGTNWTRLPESGRARIAITIDDGPDPDVTPRVLDLLDAHGARATFFCIGERVRRYPEIVADIAARGHAVENHSQRHWHNFSLLGPGALAREIEAGQVSIADVTGTRPVFFRAPAGLRNVFLEPVLCRMGLQLAAWTRRGFDTRSGEADVVARRLLSGLASRDILLLHDGHAARDVRGVPVVFEVLGRLLRRASELEFECVALRDVI
jgi:peptidoglycan-N-acetylglucosamine deacetylase